MRLENDGLMDILSSHEGSEDFEEKNKLELQEHLREDSEEGVDEGAVDLGNENEKFHTTLDEGCS